MLAPLLTLALGQFQQVLFVAQRFPLGVACLVLDAPAGGGQLEFPQVLGQFFLHVPRFAHCTTPVSPHAPSSSSKLAKATSATSMGLAGGTPASWLSTARTASAVSFPSPISPSSSNPLSAWSTRASPSSAATCRISR